MERAEECPTFDLWYGVKMAGRLEKILWSVLCGAALGMAGCDNDREIVAYGPPVDLATDSEEDAEDVLDEVDDPPADPSEEEPLISYYGPPPDY